MPSDDPFRFEQVRAWLREKALPLWATAGIDQEHGGAVEALDFTGRDAGLGYKRVRAQARQVYAFTHAGLLGFSADGAARADAVWSFLRDHAHRQDGGWVRLLGRDGSVLDPAADAYDMAFILYALAWRARGGDASALAQAHQTLDALERLLRCEDGPGFKAAEDKPGERLQNPHMHLLEACLELAQAGGGQRFADLAGEVIDLFATRLFDHDQGVLLEAFDSDWRPIRGEPQRIEPGHLYEWTWLLHRAEAVTGRRLRDEARALCAFAEAQGLDATTRFADDGLDGPGLVARRTYRLWPQTEALKAHLALFEHQGIDGRTRIAEIVGQLLDSYIAPAPPGGWIDQFGPGRRPMAPNIPSSILYHLLLAFSELLRLEPQLSAAAVGAAGASG